MGQYITPSTLPTEKYCRQLFIPDSPEWIGTITGALLPLTYASAWEQVEGISAEAAALACREMLNLYYESDGTCMDCNACFTGQFGLDDDLQYRVADDIPQFSGDGGTTWSDLPPTSSSNPSVPTLTATPGEDTEAKRCLAATRATITLASLYQQTAGKAAVDLYSAFTTLAQFLSDVNRTLFSLVWPDYYAVVNATGLFDCAACEGYLLSEPTLSTENQDILRCLLYENATAAANGVVTFDFTAVQDNLISSLGVNPGTTMFFLFAYIGGDGLNRAGNVAVTDTPDNCLVCAGEWHIDRLFGDGNADMEPVQIGTPTPRLCEYDAGDDKYIMLRTPDEANRIGAVKLTFDMATTLTHASFRQQRNDAGAGFSSYIRVEYSDTSTEDIVTVATPAGTGSTTISWDGLREDVVAVYFRLAQGGSGGFLYLLWVDLDGYGPVPVS